MCVQLIFVLSGQFTVYYIWLFLNKMVFLLEGGSVLSSSASIGQYMGIASKGCIFFNLRFHLVNCMSPYMNFCNMINMLQTIYTITLFICRAEWVGVTDCTCSALFYFVFPNPCSTLICYIDHDKTQMCFVSLKVG